MKDLVDFHNRDDFDSYMKSIEKNYYESMNLPKPPYENMPDYPPKPYQAHKSKINIEQYYEQGRNYNPNSQPQNAYIAQQQNNSFVSPYNTPFFDSVVNKENFLNSYKQPPHHQTQPHMGMPYSGPVPHGNIPQGFLGDKFGNVMEPAKMHQNSHSYQQKFVAGPLRLEQNPLGEPARHFRTSNSPQKGIENYDLKNPDGQYERYKQLMSSQYYNNHANSAHQGVDLTSTRTIYMPPPQFNQQNAYQQQFQHPSAGGPHMNQHPNVQPSPQDIYNMSFNPNAAQSHQPYHQSMHPQPGQSQVYPQAQQIYQRPNAVPLYSQPQGYHPQQPMPMMRSDMYSNIKYQNNVTNDILQSIGGIEDTLKPMQETLKQHELRPYQVQKDYRKELYYSQKGKTLKRSNSEVKPENMHLVSVSPFRAVIKVQDDREMPSYSRDLVDNDSDDEIQRQDIYGNQGVRPRSTLSEALRREHSPNKNDSEGIRGQREEFLSSFNTKRQSGLPPMHNSNQRSNQKIKQESEHMRSQREQFLNGFSANDQSFKPAMPNQQRTNTYSNLQIQI